MVMVTSRAQPGRRDEIHAAFLEIMAPRAVANPEQTLVVWIDDADDADVFHLVERYASRAAMEANAAQPFLMEYFGRVGPLLGGEPVLATGAARWSTGLS